MGEGEKQKLGVVRAFARELFRRFLRPRFLRRRGGADLVGAIGEKLPDKSKKCPRPEPFVPSFFGLNVVARTSAGVARRLCRSVPPWGPPRAPPASRALAHLGRCAVRSRTGQPMQEPQPRRPPVFLSVFAISRAPVPLFASSFFEERAERGAIS